MWNATTSNWSNLFLPTQNEQRGVLYANGQFMNRRKLHCKSYRSNWWRYFGINEHKRTALCKTARQNWGKILKQSFLATLPTLTEYRTKGKWFQRCPLQALLLWITFHWNAQDIEICSRICIFKGKVQLSWANHEDVDRERAQHCNSLPYINAHPGQ